MGSLVQNLEPRSAGCLPRTEPKWPVGPNGGGCEIVKAWPRADRHGFWASPQRGGDCSSPRSASPNCLALSLVLGLLRERKGCPNFRQCNLSKIKLGGKEVASNPGATHSLPSPPLWDTAKSWARQRAGGDGVLGAGPVVSRVLGCGAGQVISASCPAGSSSRPPRL